MVLRTLTAIALVFGICSAGASAAIVVDGDLSDWGLTVADNNGSDFTSFTPGIGLVGYHEEDQDDLALHDFFLGPSRGGQNYDAEMMAVALQGDDLYIAIATGMRPDNGFVYYAPGDIRIETSAGIYGIEVGGGKGGDPGPAITEGALGSTYELMGDATTKAHLNADPLQTAGSIWGNANWIVMSTYAVQFEIDGGSTQVGTADYIYTRDYISTPGDTTTQHAIIELSFDVNLLGGAASINSIAWMPSCANDEVKVLVPEPTTVAFLAFGGLSLLPRKKRR